LPRREKIFGAKIFLPNYSASSLKSVHRTAKNQNAATNPELDFLFNQTNSLQTFRILSLAD